MNSNQALWEKGDFTQIAAFMRQSGEAVVESIGINPPLRALDLGCGDGTTAIPLARQGAEVVGIDIAATLLRPAIGGLRSPVSRAFDSSRETHANWKESMIIPLI